MILVWVVLAVAGLLTYPDVWFWAVHRFVEVEIRVDKTRVEIGDRVSLSCRITNRAWVPLPSLKMIIPLPAGLVATGTDDYHFLGLRTRMHARETIVSVATCTAKRRGRQSFSPAEIILSEGFGFKNILIERAISDEVAVLPKFASISYDKVSLRSLLGAIEVQRWLHPDESHYKGSRPYQAGDAYKHIAWLASATSGRLMVKQFAASSDATLHLVLNTQNSEDYWTGANPDVFDEFCSTVATVAQTLGKRGFVLYFWTNAMLSGAGRKLAFGRQSAEGVRCLLAELSPLTSRPLSELLRGVLNRPNKEADVLLFTSYLTEQHVQLIQGQSETFTVISTGNENIANHRSIRKLSV